MIVIWNKAKRKKLASAKNQILVVQPTANHFIDRATPAHAIPVVQPTAHHFTD